jgi:diguanylate cyclase (GGDEF)-like protein
VTPKKNYSIPFVLSTLGVAVIIAILMAIWVMHQRQIQELRHTVEDGQLAVEKMELVASMIETARARTRLTNKMTFIEDIFEKDEINMQLDRYAARFSVLRQQLLGLPVSSEEISILESQRNVIRPTLVQQRRAAELAMSDVPADVDQAKSILIEQVYPGQGKIIDHFMQLLNLQKQKINRAGAATNQQFESYRRLQSILFIMICVVVLVVAVVSVKRLGRTDVLEHEANHDELTGLLNRRDFERKANHILANISSSKHHAFGLIDLDHFKRVNDTAGHAAGDELLKLLSRRVKENFRKSDLLARIGGDEFAFLLVDVDAAKIDKIANNILGVVRSVELEWNGESHHVGASIGIVLLDDQGCVDYKTHFRHADCACYKAKKAGRNRVVIYSKDKQAAGIFEPAIP